VKKLGLLVSRTRFFDAAVIDSELFSANSCLPLSINENLSSRFDFLVDRLAYMVVRICTASLRPESCRPTNSAISPKHCPSLCATAIDILNNYTSSATHLTQKTVTWCPPGQNFGPRGGRTLGFKHSSEGLGPRRRSCSEYDKCRSKSRHPPWL
jgi:hypothetical protein